MVTVLARNNTIGRKTPAVPSIKGEMYFVPVVDGKELSMAAETEDMALLLGIGYKYDGPNSQFGQMAARMLNIDTLWKGL